jgi:hypothetical protein
MTCVESDFDMNLNFDIVDYSEYVSPCEVEEEYEESTQFSYFDSLPMEVSMNL